MKKLAKLSVTVLLLITMMLSFTGCGEIKKAEEAVSGMFNAFKIRDFDKAQEYTDLSAITANASPDDMFSDVEMFMDLMFNRLDYEIVSSELVDKNTVNVTTRITAVDMKPVIADFFALALQYAIGTMDADPQPTEEEIDYVMERILIESATATDLAKVTNEVVIKVTKTDDGWMVDLDSVLLDALLGGLSEAVAELESSLAE